MTLRDEPRRRLLGGALAALAALPGCAYRYRPFSRYEPMLLEVRRDDRAGAAWLFGAIHAGLDRFYPLPEPVESAWQGAMGLAVELDVTRRWQELRAAFGAVSLLPPGTHIEDLVGADQARAIRTHFGFDDADWARLRRLRPWALTLSLANPVEQEAGARSSLGVDSFFLQRARERKLAIVELEQPAEQVHAFAGGADSEQVEQLLARFEQLRHWDRTLLDLIDAWRAGDERALAALKARAFGDERRLASLRKRMFSERDARMAARLHDLIPPKGKLFVVVGAFHLAGDDGLPARLRAIGARVDRVDYGAGA